MASDNQSVWFGVSMGLMGLIVGFVIGVFGAGSVQMPVRAGGQQAASVPSVPQAPNPAQPTPQVAQSVIPVNPAIDHVRGNPDAKLVLIEYSDFECPFCARVHPTYKQIMDAYGDDVAWVYRHYPLNFHSNAMPAAIASECIAQVGGNEAFWQFADIVFTEGTFDFAAVAKKIGVNEARFKSCVEGDTSKIVAHINKQMQEGSASGVSGTPGNILYNPVSKESRLIPGARPFEMFKADIDAMLAEAK